MSQRLDRRVVVAVAARDLRVASRSPLVTVPTVVVPVLVLFTGPVVLLLAPTAVADALAAELLPLLTRLPDAVLADLPVDPGARAIVLLLVFVYAPLLLVVPVVVSAVTAADSVAGERERGTLEGLLHTPTTDRELAVGKLLAPWTVAMTITVGGAVAYGALANLALARFGLPPSFPNLAWVVLVVWVAPATAGLSLGTIVALSARVRTFQEASQLGGLVVVPVVALVVAQIAGVVLFDSAVLAVLGGVLWVLALLVVRLARRSFRRDRLLSRG